MGWLGDGETVLVVILVLVCVLLSGLFLRRRVLSRGGVVLDCALRRPDASASGWMTGMVRYREERLEWYKVFSLSVRPKVSLPRRTSRVVSHRLLEPNEVELLPGLDVVTRIEGPADASGRSQTVELGMSGAATTALMSWLEASPPGLPKVIG